MRNHVFALTLLCVAIVAFLSGNYLQSPRQDAQTIRTIRVTDSETITVTTHVTKNITMWTTVSEPRWRPIVSFGGSQQSFNSDEYVSGRFKVSSHIWRIRWTFNSPMAIHCYYGFTVYRSARGVDDEDEAIRNISRSKSTGDSGILYLEEKGIYFLRIRFSFDIACSIVVEEAI